MPLLAVGARDLWAGLAPAGRRWASGSQAPLSPSSAAAISVPSGLPACDRLPAPHEVNCDGAATATPPAASRLCQTATSNRRLASAAEPARLPASSPRAAGSSRTAHSSRQLFQAKSRAELMVQLAIRLLTERRW